MGRHNKGNGDTSQPGNCLEEDSHFSGTGSISALVLSYESMPTFLLGDGLMRMDLPHVRRRKGRIFDSISDLFIELDSHVVTLLRELPCLDRGAPLLDRCPARDIPRHVFQHVVGRLRNRMKSTKIGARGSPEIYATREPASSGVFHAIECMV